MRIYFFIILLIFLVLTSPPRVFADSSYVLPYPSFMPGSKFYIIFEVKDKLSKYFYFGDFGNFKYNLLQSDKYLVEAKTLFEYKQYLLGFASLQKSNEHLVKIMPSITNSRKSGKPTKDKESLLKDASLKHIEMLEKLKEELPETFEWVPEKEMSKKLKLRQLIDTSIKLRNSYEI